MIDFEKLEMLSLEQYRADVLYAGEKSEMFWHIQFLKNTDWYVTRYAETEASIPQEILDARQESREELDRLRSLI